MIDWVQKFIDMIFPVDAKNLNIEEAFRLKYQHIPRSLFKYRAIEERSIKNFEEDTIWLSNPLAFNDPYDCSFTVDFERWDNFLVRKDFDGYSSLLAKLQIPEEVVETVKSSDSPINTLKEYILREESEESKMKLETLIAKVVQVSDSKLLDGFTTFLKNSYKICSFSERNDSVLMWSHYADSHKGFCIEYDISALPYSDFRSRFMFPVIYSSELFDVTQNLIDGESNNLRYTLSTMIKSTDWEYEREWRLIFSHGVFEKDRGFPMPSPKALYLGCKIEENHNYESLIQIALRKKIPVYRMFLSDKEFKMIPKRIEGSDF